MTWLLALLRTSRAAQLTAIVLALGLLTLTVERCTRHAIDKGQEGATEAGRQQQRADDLQETINRMETADDTRATIRDPSSLARYDECLLSARKPANCERLLPE